MSIKHIAVFSLISLVFFCPVSGQQPINVNDEAVRHALSKAGVSASSEDIELLKKKYGSSNFIPDNDIELLKKKYGGNLGSDAVKAALQDSLEKAKDTTALAIDTTEAVSVYEDILKNKILYPDSLLIKLPIFGLDMFAGTRPAPFAQADYGATPADYPVRPGDEVMVALWGRMNEEYRLKVDRDGKINIPRIGPVSVAGMPFGDMQQRILDKVQNIEGVQASVSLGELRSVGIYVVGEVKAPGMYTVSSLSNVTNALFAAGGPTRRGSLRAIQVKRNGSVIATVDFYDFLLGGKDNTGIRLKSGDAVVVPIVKSMVAIAGNVRRSALYEIKADTRLKDALALAGGLTPAAWTNRLQIERFSDNQYQMVLDLNSADGKTLPDFEIKDGDIIKVFPVLIRDKNVVYLSGNVERPGKYEFRDGMKVSDLLPDYSSLLQETYFNYAVVIRQDPPSFLDRILPFNLKAAMEDRASVENILLQPKDVVHVYLQEYFEPDRYVSIGGAVTVPGKCKLLENMKIRDLIIKAGGLLEEASAERGELYRRSSENEVIATEKIEFCVRCAMADDPRSNLALKKADRIYIRNKMGWEEERRVTLNGEFMYPGEYVLLKNETLDQLIERAGGFTEEAYLPAAVFSRPSIRGMEKEQLDKYIMNLEIDALRSSIELAARNADVRTAQQLLQQQEQLLAKLRTAESIGRVVLDLTDPGKYRNLILVDGDVLFVPKVWGTVSVIGEVLNPATFKFEKTLLKAKYYLALSGGLKSTADKKSIYIMKANGSTLTRKSGNVLEYALSPGDAVVVPQQLEYKNNFKTFMDSVDAIFKIATVITAIAMLIIAINGTK